MVTRTLDDVVHDLTLLHAFNTFFRDTHREPVPLIEAAYDRLLDEYNALQAFRNTLD